MSVIQAMLTGFRRATRSPVILLWLWLLNLGVAAPVALLVAGAIKSEIRSSRVDEKLLDGFDMEWFGEYESRTRGTARTFTPTLTGAGAFYDNFENWLGGGFPVTVEIALAGTLHVLIWALMLGGVIDRYARAQVRPTLRRFFANGARFFFRFVRLTLISGALYVLVYLLSRRLFKGLDEWTRETTSELVVFYYSLVVWGLVAFLLTLIHMSFGYAKIATVIEDRRSMFVAALRGIGFVLFHPLKTIGLYYGLLLVSVFLLALYSVVAPGVDQSTIPSIVVAFGVAQLFLLAKLLLRLTFIAGQTALYQEYAPRQTDAVVTEEAP